MRTSSDQRLLDSFPRLFAACHVLHRLLAPRHPPLTLSSLEYRESKTFCARYAVLKLPEGFNRDDLETVPVLNSFTTEQCAPPVRLHRRAHPNFSCRRSDSSLLVPLDEFIGIRSNSQQIN